MARFSLVGPAYTSQSVVADCQSLKNWYLEAIESGMGRSAYALYPTPGLSMPLYSIGGAGVRGETTILGRSFAVAGAALWELLAPNAAPNVKNWSAAAGVPIASDGKPVSIASGGHQILIASAGLAYVFDLSKNTLLAVDPSAAANLPVAYVGFSDSFFFALIQNQPPTPWQINSSTSFDATTWQGTNFTEVTPFTENPNAIFFNQRLMWAFSPRGIQPFSNTGDFPFPFDVIPGTFVENGLAAPFSLARLDNSIFWLGADERGQGMVWRMNGFTPQRVSNHAIEFAIQGYPTISDAIGQAKQINGHSFYELHFPAADKTWVFDAATNQWHERDFWNTQTGAYNRARGCFHTFNFGMHLLGDPTTGAVYQESSNIYSDFGNAIRRMRRGPHITEELEWIYFSRLQVDLETGLGLVPPQQGSKPSTVFALADSNNLTWSVRISDAGVLQAVKRPANVGAMVLNDPATQTSWQMEVSSIGVLFPVQVTFNPNAYFGLPMISLTGQTQWVVGVKQIAPGVAQFFTTPTGIVGRGPLLMLRLSKDGARTFVDLPPRDCGMMGNTIRRVYWDRLGRARDLVPEISATDAVPWRIIDGYLKADGYTPSERLNREFAKRA